MEKLTKAEKKILGVLSERPFNSQEIAETLDLHRTYVLKITKRLYERGLLNRSMDIPTYETSEFGKAAIKES
jgi:DNA-binding MarR family transcriptional regulator